MRPEPQSTDPRKPGWVPPRLTLARVVKEYLKGRGTLTGKNVDDIVLLLRKAKPGHGQEAEKK